MIVLEYCTAPSAKGVGAVEVCFSSSSTCGDEHTEATAEKLGFIGH